MSSLLNIISQCFAITAYSLRTIAQRKGASVSTAVGIAGVVAVMIGVLSIAHGFRNTMIGTRSNDVAIVLRAGASDEINSILSRSDVKRIAQAPGVAQNSGDPLTSPELFVIINLPRKSSGTDANVAVRGATAPAFQVRDRIEIVRGRMLEWGHNEVLVGEAAVASFGGLEVGDSLRLGNAIWTVVGIFTAAGSSAESEIWVDAKILGPAYQRDETFQSVRTRLVSPNAFNRYKDTLTSDPQLNVRVMRQPEYDIGQSGNLVGFIEKIGYLLAVVMGAGAVFGALNTMYTAVSARAREIATLRALGFMGTPIIFAVLAEALILGLFGGLVGAAISYAVFDGYQTATINWRSFSQVAFGFAVTPNLLVQGIVLSLVLGFLGGLFPALRAIRMPIASTLREN